jgi:hypothetical protein
MTRLSAALRSGSRLAVLLCVTFGALCLAVSEAGEGSRVECSVINLVATPERYSGRVVLVVGYYSRGEEKSMLFLSQKDEEHSLFRNGIWVELGDASIDLAGVDRLNEKYVLVEGTFDASIVGHWGLTTGGIRSVTRMEEWGGARILR